MNIKWNTKYLTNYYKISKNLKNVNLTYGIWCIKLKRIFITFQTYIDFLKKYLKHFYKKFFLKQSLKKFRSKKSLESRMGGGKGKNFYNLFIFTSGTILIECYNIYKYKILYLFKLFSCNQKYKFKFLKKKYI